ncbi:MAG TPA: XRE family transcriptional regulator [Candidatus Competibacteraceae bacterium]|nr:XRE family transcriptional regulator [Candidatus Competibacteraceae bacterium]
MNKGSVDFDKDDTQTGVGERIRRLRGRQSRDQFASLLGVSRNTLMRYEQGERQPDADFLARLCRLCGADPGWLLLGREAASTAERSGLREEFALVPLYGVEVSAGFGATIDQEQPISRLAYRRDWLTEMGLQPERVVTVQARGDSMEPTIGDGDLLLVDTRQRQLVNDAIYVIRQDQLLYVKRLQRLYDGAVRINSDNPAYAAEVVPKKDLAFLEVIGRVVWCGRRL